MTLEEIKTVQASFNRVFAAREVLGKTFYERLFEVAPCVRHMFPGDMYNMQLKIVDMLDYVVMHLSTPEILENSVAELAKRHVEYGALPEHYAIAGQALLDAIAEHSPGGLSEAEIDAWTSTYAFVSEIMIEEIHANAA